MTNATDPQHPRSLTIVVPALNEERLIALTVRELLPIARQTLDAFEVVLVDDGSRDRTGAIMDELAREYPEIRVVHNASPQGLAWMFGEFIAKARFPHLAFVVGDHANSAEGLRQLFTVVGTADLIAGRRTRMKRPLLRRLVSIGFWCVASLLFGFRIRDWTGMFIWPVPMLRNLNPLPKGNGYSVEVLIQLLRRNVSVRTVAVPQNPEERGSSKIVNGKTFRDVVRMFWRVWRSQHGLGRQS